MLPTTLEGWTIEAIEALLERGVFESETFDFKEMLPHKSDSGGKLRLRKECCAFANSDGGFLIFGVADDRNLRPADRLVGIDPTVELPLQFGEYPQRCTPSIYWIPTARRISDANANLVHIVHIPRSWRAPHVAADDQRSELWHFPKRTNKGIEPTSYEEVRMAFTGYYERQRKLGLLREELVRAKRLAPSFLISEGGANAFTHDAGELSLGIIEAVMSDSFLILEGCPALLYELHTVRQMARLINHATARYFQQLTRLPIGQHSPYMLKQHNINVRQWSDQLARSADRCIQEIDRLGSGSI